MVEVFVKSSYVSKVGEVTVELSVNNERIMILLLVIRELFLFTKKKHNELILAVNYSKGKM